MIGSKIPPTNQPKKEDNRAMQPESLSTTKEAWRSWARTASTLQTDHSNQVVRHLKQFLKTNKVRRVLAYYALPNEPNLSSLASDFELFTTRARFKPVRRLSIHPWDSATEISRFGVLQPPKNTPEISLSQMDAILLPALAFDVYGSRLGYGGGFYDRLLPEFKGLRLGVIWQGLVVPKLPHELHDCTVQGLATEQGVFYINSSQIETLE